MRGAWTSGSFPASEVYCSRLAGVASEVVHGEPLGLALGAVREERESVEVTIEFEVWFLMNLGLHDFSVVWSGSMRFYGSTQQLQTDNVGDLQSRIPPDH
jgi:hypothetical protein